jgi:hypothetical protein
LRYPFSKIGLEAEDEMASAVLPIALCILAVIAGVWYARGDAQRASAVHRVFLLAVSICLTGVTLLTFGVASAGGPGGGVSFIIFVMTVSVSVPGGLALFLLLRPSRRGLPLLLAVSSPFVLWAAMVSGGSLAPEKQTINRADAIILALDDYHAATGRYPQTLEALLTGYLQALPEVTGPFDWFYASSGDSYRLGYVPVVERWTYTAYTYASEHATWETDVYPLNAGPFVIPPTPFSS